MEEEEEEGCGEDESSKTLSGGKPKLRKIETF